MLAAIKFKVRGSLKFLSHAETLKIFQRACVRAGISVQYSKGFNPRPRISLPLPRSVGVESDDELLCAQLSHESKTTGADLDASQIESALSSQLPEGCELTGIRIVNRNTPFRPRLVTYVLPVCQEYLDEKLDFRIKHLLAAKSLCVRRRSYKNGTTRNVDVRGFLKSMNTNEKGVVIECGTSSTGSVRVEEILWLLELDKSMLAAPVRRTRVYWEKI